MGDRRPLPPLQSKDFSYDRQDRERHFDEALGAYDDRHSDRQLDPHYNHRSYNRLHSPTRNPRRGSSPPRPNDDIRRSRRNEEDYGRNNLRVPAPAADDYGRGDKYSRQPSRNDIDSGIGSGPGRNSSNENFRDRRDDDDRWNEHDDRASRRYNNDRVGSNVCRQASCGPGYDRYADSDYRNEPISRQENFRRDDYGSDSRFSRNDETIRDRDGRGERQASRIQSPVPARRDYANSRDDEKLRHANNRRRSPSPNPPKREYVDASKNERINLDNIKEGQWYDCYAERENKNPASRSSRNDERDYDRGYGRGDSKDPLSDDRQSHAERVRRHLHDEAVKELIANSQITEDVESDDERDMPTFDNRQCRSRSDSRRNSPPKYFDRFGNYPFMATTNDRRDDRDSDSCRYSNDPPPRAEPQPRKEPTYPRRNDENFDDRHRSSRQSGGYKSPEFDDHRPPQRKDVYRNDPYEDDARRHPESYDRPRRDASPNRLDFDAPPRPSKNEMIRRNSNANIPYSNQNHGYRTTKDQDPNRTPTPTRGEYGLDARDGGYGNGAAPPRGRDDFGPARDSDYPDRSTRSSDLCGGGRDDRGPIGGEYRHAVQDDGYRNPPSGRRDWSDPPGDSGYIDNRRSAKQEDFGDGGGRESQLIRGGYDAAGANRDNGYNNNSSKDYGSRQYFESSRPTQGGGGAASGGYESHPSQDGAMRSSENNKGQYPPPADSGYQSRQENGYPPSSCDERAPYGGGDDRQNNSRPFNSNSNNREESSNDYSNRQSNPPPPSKNGYTNDRNGYAPAASANRGSNGQGDNRGGPYHNNHPNNHFGNSAINRTTNSSNYHNNSAQASATPVSFYIPPPSAAPSAASNVGNRQLPAARLPPSPMPSTNNAADLNDEEWD